jgi:hypothetical protein
MHQQNQPPTRRALKRPPNNQFLHRLGRRTNGRAGKENGKRSQHDGLAAPDIRQLGPDRTRGGVGKQVRAADPGVARRTVEIAGYGREGCRDNCCV